MISAEEFKDEVRALAAEIRVEPKEVHLGEMKNKWGSCSTRGRLTFNTARLAEPAAKRRKIVVHELLHLRGGAEELFADIVLNGLSMMIPLAMWWLPEVLDRAFNEFSARFRASIKSSRPRQRKRLS